MIPRNRLTLYILLNILISAAVTISLLFVYDRYFRPPQPVIVSAITPVATGNAEGGLDIVGVVGAGTLENEALSIRNNGKTEVNLTGWELQAANGKTFTLPGLTLLSGGSVTVHSAKGDNTVVDLFWGLSGPIWESGQLVTLLDADGNVRALYRIP